MPSFVVLALACAIGAEPGAAAASARWEPIGLSGGGAMFTPADGEGDGRRE